MRLFCDIWISNQNKIYGRNDSRALECLRVTGITKARVTQMACRDAQHLKTPVHNRTQWPISQVTYTPHLLKIVQNRKQMPSVHNGVNLEWDAMANRVLGPLWFKTTEPE